MSPVFSESTATSCKRIPTLDANMVCARFGISERTLSRWQKDAALGFPEPTYLWGRRWWPESEIVNWDTRQFGMTYSVGD